LLEFGGTFEKIPAALRPSITAPEMMAPYILDSGDCCRGCALVRGTFSNWLGWATSSTGGACPWVTVKVTVALACLECRATLLAIEDFAGYLWGQV